MWCGCQDYDVRCRWSDREYSAAMGPHIPSSWQPLSSPTMTSDSNSDGDIDSERRTAIKSIGVFAQPLQGFSENRTKASFRRTTLRTKSGRKGRATVDTAVENGAGATGGRAVIGETAMNVTTPTMMTTATGVIIESGGTMSAATRTQKKTTMVPHEIRKGLKM